MMFDQAFVHSLSGDINLTFLQSFSFMHFPPSNKSSVFLNSAEAITSVQSCEQLQWSWGGAQVLLVQLVKCWVGIPRSTTSLNNPKMEEKGNFQC